MKPFNQFVEYITEHTEELAEKVVERVCSELPEAVPEEERRQAYTMYTKLWKSLAESLKDDVFEMPEALMEWSRVNAAEQTKNGGGITVIVNRYPATRSVFSDLLVEISESMQLSLAEYARVNKKINMMLDMSLNETYYAFERLSALYRKSAEQELAQLSAPVVPLQDGVVVMPFIGELTDDRASAIMDNVLPKVAKMDVEYTIADFSGIVNVDNHVVCALRQIEESLSLMGIQVISTGMRPELAQKMITSGIGFVKTKYYGTVKQALESLT